MSSSAETFSLLPDSGIFWVGSEKKQDLHYNPYLIIDGDEAVLVDPVSSVGFETVLHNIATHISLDKIKYIVLQHQDPELCASIPMFECHGIKASLVAHWQTAQMAVYYGITSPFYVINKNQVQLEFGNKRLLEFYLTPYLHFPGTMITYDSHSKALFPSDLFGSLSADQALFADDIDSYHDSLIAFHELYFPNAETIQPILKKMLQMDIQLIAPQHGAIIRHNIQSYISALHDFNSKTHTAKTKKNRFKFNGYIRLLNLVLKRYYIAYPLEEILEIFKDTAISLSNKNGFIAKLASSEKEVWRQFFELIYSRKGISWLVYIEPFVTKVAAEYEVEVPDIFHSALLSLEQTNQHLDKENQSLKETNERLSENLRLANETLLKCPITKLNNERVFLQYLIAECRSFPNSSGGCLLLIGMDNLAKINLAYGSEIGDEVLKTLAYLLNETLESHHALFKTDGPVFACYQMNTEKAKAAEYAEKIRYLIEQSDRFIQPVTVSISIASLSEFSDRHFQNSEKFAKRVFKTAKNRLQTARRKSGNTICAEEDNDALQSIGKVILVDTDELHQDILKCALEDCNVTVFTANDGETALSIVNNELPDVIISELLLPKVDGFLLRSKLKQDSTIARIPFIVISFLKDDDSVQRALMLDIEHYFQKPYTLSEVVGLILLKLRH